MYDAFLPGPRMGPLVALLSPPPLPPPPLDRLYGDHTVRSRSRPPSCWCTKRWFVVRYHLSKLCSAIDCIKSRIVTKRVFQSVSKLILHIRWKEVEIGVEGSRMVANRPLKAVIKVRMESAKCRIWQCETREVEAGLHYWRGRAGRSNTAAGFLLIAHCSLMTLFSKMSGAECV